MAENPNDKEYFTQPDEVGSIKISEEVVASIAGLATAETDGVASLATGLAGDIASFLGKKTASRGVKIIFEEKNVTIELFILVKYGYVIPDVAKKVQDRVHNAIESMTGLAVTAINVNVTGVFFETKNRKLPEETK